MSENTRSLKTKDVTDEEAREYLLQISAHLNEIAKLVEKKAGINKSLNAQIKTEEGKLESLRIILNDGIVITVHNFMDKDTHEIIWKDDDGNEVDRTSFDDKDWDIFNYQAQGTLFKDDEPITTTGEYPTRPELQSGDIINAESEDIPADVKTKNSPDDGSSTWTADFNEHGEEEVEAERKAS